MKRLSFLWFLSLILLFCTFLGTSQSALQENIDQQGPPSEVLADAFSLSVPPARSIGWFERLKDGIALRLSAGVPHKADRALTSAEKDLNELSAIESGMIETGSAQRVTGRYEDRLSYVEEKLTTYDPSDPEEAVQGIAQARARLLLHKEFSEEVYLARLDELQDSSANEQAIERLNAWYNRTHSRIDRSLQRFDELEQQLYERMHKRGEVSEETLQEIRERLKNTVCEAALHKRLAYSNFTRAQKEQLLNRYSLRCGDVAEALQIREQKRRQMIDTLSGNREQERKERREQISLGDLRKIRSQIKSAS